MLSRLRTRTQDESGFTLIELLVVILIIGILAAIAIPAFLSQKSKANDAAAKTQVGTLQTAMETYSTEHSGSYAGATLVLLQAVEPSLKEVTSYVPTAEGLTAEEYIVSSKSVATGNVFTLTSKGGEVKRTCTGKGGCVGGTW
jgi:type IV pilus assembly protein PilA